MLRTFFLLLAFALSLTARADPVSELELKGMYLYNFAKHTEWPESDLAMFNICILGDNDLGVAMHKLEGRAIHGRRLVVARLSSMAALRNCQVLFIGRDEIRSLPQIKSKLGDEPVLTVVDVPNVPSVCITVLQEGERLSFDVNMPQCQRGKLKPTTPMLRLARNVAKEP